MEYVGLHNIREEEEQTLPILLHVADQMLEDGGQSPVHHIPYGVAEGWVLNHLLQEVHHRLEEGGLLQSALHPAHQLWGSRRITTGLL